MEDSIIWICHLKLLSPLTLSLENPNGMKVVDKLYIRTRPALILYITYNVSITDIISLILMFMKNISNLSDDLAKKESTDVCQNLSRNSSAEISPPPPSTENIE